MITEIKKLLEAKEIELKMVQLQAESLVYATGQAFAEADLELKFSKNFWSAFNALNNWADALTTEVSELKSMLEKSNDVQSKLDQLTK